ncbi:MULTISPECIES: inositol monophosphatase family protein [unclassified Sphingomonas]|uniref:inositol monophosphatase family protein n=1 Tax=Novosphingobium rhizosphaerae TaxID=1551649 RepID=UPI0015CB3DF3
MSWTAEIDAAVGTLIARVAQEAIAPRYRQLADDDVTAKAADDVVTVADTHAERLLSEGLAALLPKATIVGEEAAHADPTLLDRLGDGLCWIIDPLDGTNNFAAGKPPFGVLIALAEHGECVAGWIYDVLSGRLCTAQKGRGAFVNGTPVRAQATGQVPPVAAISTVFMDMAQRQAMRQHILPHYSVVDIPRCAAEQYPRLLLGVNDVSIFERTLAWDHAAGVLFVNEAGGKAARPDGRPYRVDQVGQKGLVAASSPALFDAMAERLAAL